MWTSDLLASDFRPAQVEALTGVDQGLLRKWASRYFDFRGSHAAISGDTDHRWYSWIGVQMVTVFRDVLSDLGNAAEARAALMVDPVPGLTRNGINTFAHDWCYRSGSDLLLVRDFDMAEPIFLTVGSSSLSILSRGYLYNLSAMQRRLVKRAVELSLVESSLADLNQRVAAGADEAADGLTQEA